MHHNWAPDELFGVIIKIAVFLLKDMCVPKGTFWCGQNFRHWHWDGNNCIDHSAE